MSIRITNAKKLRGLVGGLRIGIHAIRGVRDRGTGTARGGVGKHETPTWQEGAVRVGPALLDDRKQVAVLVVAEIQLATVVVNDAGDLAPHLWLLRGCLGEVVDREEAASGVGHFRDLESGTAWVVVVGRLVKRKGETVAVLVGDVGWVAGLIEEIGHPVGTGERPPMSDVGR